MVEDGAGASSPFTKMDFSHLAEISDGDTVFEKEIATEYLTQAWTLIETATRALERHDAVELHRIAHTLKGSSHTIGAEGVAELAAVLEAMAKSSTQGTASLLARTLACLVATERELNQHFGIEGDRKAA